MKAYLIDLDGTLANNDHRQHFLEREPRDWKGFFDAMGDDKPIPYMIEMCNHLFEGSRRGNGSLLRIIILTGRPENYRTSTEIWLLQNRVRYHTLIMRHINDYRGDAVVKEEMLHQLRADDYEIILAIEDRPPVIEMWRRNDVPVLEVFNPLWARA